MLARRVVITGLGIVAPGLAGGWQGCCAWLQAAASTTAGVADALAGARLDETELRRLSRVSRLAVAAGRIAVADAGVDARRGLGLVTGSELGDLRSTMEFADGYLRGGPAGLSALLFPNTVMNAMGAATAIALGAREASQTLNVPAVAGELAVAKAAAAIRAGRADAVLAGGVDEVVAVLAPALASLGARERRGEGAAFLVLESLTTARARGARIVGEVAAEAWGALRARPAGVGRTIGSRAIPAALERGGLTPGAIAWVSPGATGDGPRDRWHEAIVAGALPDGWRPLAALGPRLGQHAALGAVRVAAAALADGPALVYAVARGGTEVALVVAPHGRSEAAA